MTNKNKSSNQNLIGPIGLLKRASSEYKENFWVLMGIMLFPIILNLILTFTQPGSAQSRGIDYFEILKSILLVFMAIVSILISTWAYLAVIFVIRDDKSPLMGIYGAYQKSLSTLPSYIYVNILIAIATIPGILLLGIPTIIYMVWFAFSAFVMVAENYYGANALMRSREYVTHRWWQVAGRVFFIILLVFLAQFLGSLFNQFLGQLIPRNLKNITLAIQVIITNLIVILTVPLSISYAYTLYLNLKETRPELAGQPVNEKYKWLYIFSPTTILIIVVFLLVFLIKAVKGI